MNKKVELNAENYETKSIEFKALIEQLKTERSELEDLIRDENKSTLKAADHETNDESSNKIIND